MSFRHVALFRWTPEATDEQRREVLEALAGLPALIPEIRSYRFGPDAGLAEGNHDLALVADFDSPDDYAVYASHPAHLELIRDLVRPILAERAAVQHHLG